MTQKAPELVILWCVSTLLIWPFCSLACVRHFQHLLDMEGSKILYNRYRAGQDATISVLSAILQQSVVFAHLGEQETGGLDDYAGPVMAAVGLEAPNITVSTTKAAQMDMTKQCAN